MGLGGIVSSVFGGGESKSSTDTTNTTNDWALPYWKTLFNNANNQFKNGGFYGADYNNGNSTVAGLTPEQLAAITGMSSQGANQQQFLNTTGMDSLASTLGDFNPNNPSISNAVNSALAANTTNFQRTVLPSIASTAMVNGRTGSNREGVAQGLAMSDLNNQNLNTANQMYSSAYSQHENARNSALQNMGNIIQGMNAGNNQQLEAGGMLQNQNQLDLNAALQSWAYKNDMPLKNLTALQSLFSSITPGTSTSSASGTSPSGGGLGGMLGSFAGGKLGGIM